MCQALRFNGHEVTLITKHCPERQERNVVDDFQFYGVAPVFKVVKLPRPARPGGEVRYSAAQWKVLREKRGEIDLVYSRDLFGAWMATKLGYPTIFEAHGLPAGTVSRYFYSQIFQARSFKRLVVISAALQNEFERLGLLTKRPFVKVAHDGADLPSVKLNGMGLPPQLEGEKRPKIGYVGNLYAGRGVELIIELAYRLSQYSFHIVGGTRGDLAAWSDKPLPENLICHGFVSQEEISHYYQQFDILLMPYQKKVIVASGRTDTSIWMSPLKMFEYMAAGKAVVSSDLPVLREVLENERNALLVPPDDVAAWAAAIVRLVEDESLQGRLGSTAQQDLINHYTWQKRAQNVVDGL